MLLKEKKLNNFLSENSEVMKIIKTIVWIATIVAAVILWYVNDTDAKYVSKDIYNTEKQSAKELIHQEFEGLKTHITSENGNIKSQLDTLKTDVKKKYDTLNASVQEVRTEQTRLRTQQDRLLRHQ